MSHAQFFSIIISKGLINCSIGRNPNLCYSVEHILSEIEDCNVSYWEKLKERNIVNVIKYFSNRQFFISIHKKDVEKYTLPCLTPGKIQINVSGHMSGNAFLNLYEEYFSDFDRFRVNMICSNIQHIFGYPYVSSKSFSMRQQQEMFLKKIRFEDSLSNVNDDCRMRYHKALVYKVHIYLQRAHREEIMYDMETNSLWEGIRILGI